MAASKKSPTRKKAVKKTVKKKSPARSKSVKKSVKKKVARTKPPRVKKTPVKKKAAKKKGPGGRPPEIWKVDGKKLSRKEMQVLICEMTATSSLGLKRICEADGFPSHTSIIRWKLEDGEFSSQYTRAKQAQADYLFDEMIEIADDSSKDFKTIIKRSGEEEEVLDSEHIQRSKLRVEVRRFHAGKLKPKQYGDKLDLNVTERRIEMTPEQFAAWKRNFG